jgi:hypothetical protein
MSRICLLALTLFATFATTAFGAASSVEVLYVTGTQQGRTTLLTYNVNPATAVAAQVGQTIFIDATSVDPVTIGDKHVIYVWNSKSVWTYLTDERGVPQAEPEQHLKFKFPYPVTTFVANPDGKFAYAGVIWWDSQAQTSNASVYLFTIDQSTGALTNLEEAVAEYGPNSYVSLTGFKFGLQGNKLFASSFNDGPFTCEWGYDYYPVNQNTGHLGSLENILAGGSCSGVTAVAVSDQVGGSAGTCCGPGSGGIFALQMATNKQIECTPSMLTFCGDDVNQNGLYFDPPSRNLFFADADANEIYIGRLNFANSTITESDSAIPGNPRLFFSPDSLLVYAQYDDEIEIYAFQPSTGTLTDNHSLAVQGNAKVATATLQN